MIEIEGIRTDCVTGEKRKVKLQAEIILQTEGPCKGEKYLQLYGGPTGYESFYIRPDHYETYKDDNNYWVACVGDLNMIIKVWDRLEIPASEMRKVLGSG